MAKDDSTRFDRLAAVLVPSLAFSLISLSFDPTSAKARGQAAPAKPTTILEDVPTLRIDAREFLNRGRTYAGAGRTVRAIAEYDRGIAIDPDDAELRICRAAALALRGEWDRAIMDINAGLGRSPSLDAWAYLNRGAIERKKGSNAEALADYDRALLGGPGANGLQALVGRGQVESLAGRYDKAIADFDRAIALFPLNPTTYFNRGQARLRKGELDGALADFEMEGQLDPRDPWAWYGCGLVRSRRGEGEGEKAITDFGRAIHLNGKAPQAYLERARVYLARHESDLALADFSRSIQLQRRLVYSVTFDPDKERSRIGEWPGDVPETKVLWHVGARKVPRLSGRDRDVLDRAIDDFDLARRRDPRMSWVVTFREADAARIRQDERPLLGLSLVRETRPVAGGEPTYSIIAVQFGMRAQPDLAAAYIGRGWAHREKGAKATAVADFRKAIKVAVDSETREEARRLCRELDPE